LKAQSKHFRFVQVGHYGFDWMSRMPDPIIYDKCSQKYYVQKFKKIEQITLLDMQKNCKNINNYNMYYKLYDKSNYLPISYDERSKTFSVNNVSF